jgi:hypothetical protein
MICGYFAPSPNNIRTAPNLNKGNEAYELKPALINMVMASPIGGRVVEDTNTLLQNF